MAYAYLLVLFMVHAEEPGFVPDVMEQTYPTAIQCWSAGFALKTANPQGIRWFNCERVQEDLVEINRNTGDINGNHR
jgi:hypothetical protein